VIDMHSTPSTAHGQRNAAQLLQRTLAQWQAMSATQDFYLFAYGSLIWRPDFDFLERHLARVQGFHRALRMRSRTNRGSPEQPGLVLTLLSGGCCRGLVYRVPAVNGEKVMRGMWDREMPNGVYDPKWLNCETAQGPVRAMAFTLSRRSPAWTGAITDAELLHIFGHARGRYGTTLDYLLSTVKSLREHGIHDAELERQAHLAARHGLCSPLAP
jgi:cation transport protein ChaC